MLGKYVENCIKIFLNKKKNSKNYNCKDLCLYVFWFLYDLKLFLDFFNFSFFEKIYIF